LNACATIRRKASPGHVPDNTQAIITAAKAFGDVILLMDHQPAGAWNYTNDAQFVADIYALAATNNVRYSTSRSASAAWPGGVARVLRP